MKKPASSHLFVFSLALGVGAVLMTAVIGTAIPALIFLLIAAVSFGVAMTSRRAVKPAIALEQSSSWKKFLAGGGLMLGALIVLINLPANRDQDLSTIEWSMLMLAIFTSLSLIGAGVVLGVIGRNRTRKR